MRPTNAMGHAWTTDVMRVILKFQECVILVEKKMITRSAAQRQTSKRGVELSLNIIVIAAIVLIVMIVLIFIVTGRISLFNQGINDCKAKGGIAKESNQQCLNEGGVPMGDIIGEDGKKTDEICCRIQK